MMCRRSASVNTSMNGRDCRNRVARWLSLASSALLLLLLAVNLRALVKSLLD